MALTLTLRNASSLDNGSPTAIVLDRRGATIGRAQTADWCLPDPTLHISSRHCEIRFVGGNYELVDRSTNGTFLEGESARLPAPHVLSQGDVFIVGPYEISVSLGAGAASASPPPAAASPEWRGWTGAADPADSAAPIATSNWDQRPVGSAISGTGPMSGAWEPPRAQGAESRAQWAPPPPPTPDPRGWGAPANASPPPSSGWGAPVSPAPNPSSDWGAPSGQGNWSAAEPDPSPWGQSSGAPLKPASEWSSAPAVRPSGLPDDVWGKFAETNLVDWARGGFGDTGSAARPTFSEPTPAPLPRAAPPPPAPPHPPPAPPQAASAQQARMPDPPSRSGQALAEFAASAGLPPDRLQMGEAATIAAAGGLLRRLIAGLVVMLEARMRAKNQLGAQVTSLEFDGNNPLKFARSPDQALLQLLNPPERGFMDNERAIEDAFRDLQAHQMATLSAMQGALRATLDRFSPTAIRTRVPERGFLAGILPWVRSARMWDTYEREFSGVARGSDEAFMDVFAREFRRAYDEMSRRR